MLHGVGGDEAIGEGGGGARKRGSRVELGPAEVVAAELGSEGVPGGRLGLLGYAVDEPTSGDAGTVEHGIHALKDLDAVEHGELVGRVADADTVLPGRLETLAAELEEVITIGRGWGAGDGVLKNIADGLARNHVVDEVASDEGDTGGDVDERAVAFGAGCGVSGAVAEARRALHLEGGELDGVARSGGGFGAGRSLGAVGGGEREGQGNREESAAA